MDTVGTQSTDAVRDTIAQQLSQTPYACSSYTRLSGGTANFIYRGTRSENDTIIIKHGKDYVASNSSFKLDTQRCFFEQAILKAVESIEPCSENGITIQTPRVLHFDAETNTQIQEDLPGSENLKAFLLEKASSGVSESYSRSLGISLGKWLRSFHEWGNKPEQEETRSTLAKNISMKQVKLYVTYGMLLQTVDNFPEILGESRGLFEKVHAFAMAESENEVLGDLNGLVHGDFWTGNVLISKSAENETKVFIIDWELAHIGHRSSDIGQVIAELYKTKLFKNIDQGLWIIQGFLKGYGPLSDELAFRVAIHVGTHLICWGSRVPGWGSPEQIEDVVKIGRDLVVQAWNKNRAWFDDDALGCLFTN